MLKSINNPIEYKISPVTAKENRLTVSVISNDSSNTVDGGAKITLQVLAAEVILFLTTSDSAHFCDLNV